MDSNKKRTNYYEEAQKIKKWLDENGIDSLFRLGTVNATEEEVKLFYMIKAIEKRFVEAYSCCYSVADEEKFFDRMQSKYQITRAQFQEIAHIMNPIHEFFTRPISIRTARKQYEEEYKKVSDPISEMVKPVVIEKVTDRHPSKRKAKEEEPIYLVNAREILKWMKENNSNSLPKRSGGEKESFLCGALTSIRQNLIRPFKQIQDEDQRIVFFDRIARYSGISEQQFFEILHIVEEIEKIVEENDKHPCIEGAKSIIKWLEKQKTKRLPRASGDYADEEEMKLGRSWQRIYHNYYLPYQECESLLYKDLFIQKKSKYISRKQFMKLIDLVDQILVETEESRESRFLSNAKLIREWVMSQENPRMPDFQKKDVSDYERKLGTALNNIRHIIIKPYQDLDNENDRLGFIKTLSIKEEEFWQILEIIRETEEYVKENKIPLLLKKAIALREWVINENGNKAPRRGRKGTYAPKESSHGKTITQIERSLIDPFKKCETDEQKADFFKKIKEEHNLTEEQFKRICDIYDEVFENSEPFILKRVEMIKEWMEERKTKIPPKSRGKGKDRIEKSLGRCYEKLRGGILREYDEIETPEQEKTFFQKIKVCLGMRKNDFFKLKGIIEEIAQNDPTREIGTQEIGISTYTADAPECDKAGEVIKTLEDKRKTNNK